MGGGVVQDYSVLHVMTNVALAGLVTLVAVIDARTYRIPDALNALIVVAGLTANWLLGRDLASAAIGAGVGFASIFVVNSIYRQVRARDGIGMGDAKLMAGAGAWVGWTGLPLVLLGGSALGLAYAIALRRKAGDRIPFGPFLGVALLITWCVMVTPWPAPAA